MSSAAVKKIQKELQDLSRKPVDSCSAGPIGDDMTKWEGNLFGPEGPWENGTFYFTIDFPEDYPSKGPTVVFKTKVYHPNINPNGKVCLKLLNEWTPKNSVTELLNTLYTLFMDPNPDDASTDETAAIALQYRENKEEFEKQARDWTEKFAMYVSFFFFSFLLKLLFHSSISYLFSFLF